MLAVSGSVVKFDSLKLLRTCIANGGASLSEGTEVEYRMLQLEGNSFAIELLFFFLLPTCAQGVL